AVSYRVGNVPQSLAVGDFNEDGLPDLAVVFLGGVRVLLANRHGTFPDTPSSYVARAAPISVAVGDFNGDGCPDLAVANFLSNDVSILFNDANQSSGGAARVPGAGGRAHGAPQRQMFIRAQATVLIAHAAVHRDGATAPTWDRPQRESPTPARARVAEPTA